MYCDDVNTFSTSVLLYYQIKQIYRCVIKETAVYLKKKKN